MFDETLSFLIYIKIKDTNLSGNEFLLWHTHVYTLKSMHSVSGHSVVPTSFLLP